MRIPPLLLAAEQHPKHFLHYYCPGPRILHECWFIKEFPSSTRVTVLTFEREWLLYKIPSVPFYPFLLQCHTWRISKVVDEIWSGSILKSHTISFLQIIKYIAATRKHCSPVFLEIMINHEWDLDQFFCYIMHHYLHFKQARIVQRGTINGIYSSNIAMCYNSNNNWTATSN